jgi:glycosyltransferase involved in cell wall biosynthesis
MDIALAPEAFGYTSPAPVRRFDRAAITSVFGDPRALSTWSGAPANLASALERLGVRIQGIHPRIGRLAKMGTVLADAMRGRGLPLSGEQILRSPELRRSLGDQVAEQATRMGVRDVIHTGTFDLPACSGGSDVRHYLYCDHTWALSRRHHVHADRFTMRALHAYEEGEHAALSGLAHVFTFGTYVRDNLIAHYGLAPERVTAVGSGMGAIAPYDGPKHFDVPRLLFVAKHLFQAKGGILLLTAFEQAIRQRPDLTLTIVADVRSRRDIPPMRGVEFHSHLSWEELQRLYRTSTLLVQPMLNDPWGQVYLEAMISRTPVMGLARNGLPELVDGGRHGFLVDRAEPQALAQAILCAVSDPQRLESMAAVGQRYVLGTHSWDRVAERVLFS